MNATGTIAVGTATADGTTVTGNDSAPINATGTIAVGTATTDGTTLTSFVVAASGQGVNHRGWYYSRSLRKVGRRVGT